MELTGRLAEALAYAERLHRTQKRKGTATPYISHLLAVCSLVLEWGADEEVAIAALLHDAVEDQGGAAQLNAIEERFGTRVAGLVVECSDNHGPGSDTARQPWSARKGAYIASIASKTNAGALITTADKTHNARSINADLERSGAETLSRFSRPELVTWYYEQVLVALAARPDTLPLTELKREVHRMRQLAQPCNGGTTDGTTLSSSEPSDAAL